jgi:hypothetical protein
VGLEGSVRGNRELGRERDGKGGVGQEGG